MDVFRIAFLLGAIILVPVVLVAYISATEAGLKRLPRTRQPLLRPWFWIGPAVFLAGVFLVFPSIVTLVLSFFDRTGANPVGLANYTDIFADSGFHITLRNNALWLVVFTGMVLVFGLLIAVLADRVPYEGPAKSLIFMPMAISLVAAALIWSFMYDYQTPPLPQTGSLNAVVVNGLHRNPVPWIIDPTTNNFALIVVGIWGWTGFAMIFLSAALKGIPGELLEAARVDGANELVVFFRVILPILMPTVVVVGTTLVIIALKAFDVVYVMTAGNYGTNILALNMYQELFNARDSGRASAIAIVLLVAVIPVLYFNIRRIRFQEAIR
jgi:alpha-glucoside transport system permease protein